MKNNDECSSLNHNSDIPLYHQLAEQLENSISSGLYREREKIPSENDLCEMFGVSRITVRQALKLLEQRELIYSVHGKGNFVKFPIISQQLFKITNFSKVLKEQGLHGRTTVHAYHDNSIPDAQIEKIMKPQQFGALSRLELIGFAQNIPIVYYNSLIRSEIGDDMHQYALELMNKGAPFSTYDTLQKAGIRVGQISQTISACNAGPTIGAILKVPQKTALIMLKTIIFDINKVPIEYKTGYYLGDKFSFELKREI